MRLKVAITLVVGFVVGVFEEKELDLTGDHRQEAERLGSFNLATQHGSRRDLDQFACVDIV